MTNKQNSPVLFGPFEELLTMDGLPASGPIKDSNLPIIKEGGLLVSNGKVVKAGLYSDLALHAASSYSFKSKTVALPAYIDAHTHMCFAGSRSQDFMMRLQGKTYSEIAREGGGILRSVKATRQASKEELMKLLLERLQQKLRDGIGTAEIKSGYGLDEATELKMLSVINEAKSLQPIKLIPTLLAAHTLPPEFDLRGAYLEWIVDELFPKVKDGNLTERVDIFCDDCAFTVKEASYFLFEAKAQGFTLTCHADQFSRGGALVAANLRALSADHLEASEEEDLLALKRSGTYPIVLPGASLGLGMPFARARKMLDLDLPLVIASDWNPGSAPSGDLVTQASILAVFEKLTVAETLAAITYRAASALKVAKRGILKPTWAADFVVYQANDHRDIIYRQGALKPSATVIGGVPYLFSDP
ncbi:imidazolonepropionase [Estrella lausannensis]|uniref:Imidazolonepropionase n=1 Tax=Estrella lausannensis TaxID=483423 RepID=A0A0H5DSD3_9BACT|nr:imidazolonepropionase [Estrella lausannensis]CRX38674.1 Imidazolonepropionase [Estrella lausannensis]